MNLEGGNFISLKLVDFKQNEADKFSYLLDLAEFGLLPLWQVVNTETSDFYLLPEKPKTHNFKGLPRERCLFYKEGHNAEKENAVRIDHERTPGIQSLISLLNRLSAQFLQEKPVVVAASPVESPAKMTPSKTEDKPTINSKGDSSFFNPHQGLLKHLLQETTRPVVFKNKDKPDASPIYIYPDKKIYYCQSPLERLYADYEKNCSISVTQVIAPDLEAAFKKFQLAPQPLAYLIWYAAYKLSNGNTMLGHYTNEFIRLIRIPIQGVDSGSFMKLAVYMKNYTAPLEAAAKETGTDLELAINFYNASYLVGLIEKTTETGKALKVEHDAFSDSYLKALYDTVGEADGDNPPSDGKHAAKHGFMGKLIDRLKH